MAVTDFNFMAFAASEAGVVITALLIAMLMAVIGGMFWYFKKDMLKKYFLKYPVKVVIFEKRGDTIVPVATDAGTAVTSDGGKIIYWLKNRGDKIQAPEFDALTANNWLFLFSPTRGEYHPMLLKPIAGVAEREVLILDDEGKPILDDHQRPKTKMQRVEIPIAQIQPIMSESMKYVYADTVRSNFQRFYKPDFMTKYMPLMIILAVSIGIMLILYVSLGQMQPFANAFAAAANQCGALVGTAMPTATPLPKPPI